MGKRKKIGSARTTVRRKKSRQDGLTNGIVHSGIVQDVHHSTTIHRVERRKWRRRAEDRFWENIQRIADATVNLFGKLNRGK